jgi:predicted RND superfamily exporter protein
VIAAITNLAFNGNMSLVTAIVLGFALPLTLIVLPVLLMMFDRDEPVIVPSFEPITNATTV